jgi:glycyl-tRNA synthetase beta chain
MAKNLIFEIGTEEIPSSYIGPALKQLQELFEAAAKEHGLKYEHIKSYSTPRRLALYVEKLDEKSEDRVEEFNGPSAKAGKAPDGTFTQAAKGFAQKHGIPVEKLTIKNTDKGEYLCVVKKIHGEKTEKILALVLPALIKKIYFPKTMVWEESQFRFARPARTIIALYGDKVVKFILAGIKSSNYTVGLHATSAKKITISAPEKYPTALRNNCVLADSAERREILCRIIESAAKRAKGKVIKDESLVDEVNFLVEHPVAVLGQFDEKFLKLPKEVLVTCMRKKQKFFAIEDADGKLMNCFIGIRNGISEHQEVVREGYEKVLVARLMDAEFFFSKDTKTSLESKAEKLKKVMFQEVLGSVFEKSVRMEQIAVYAVSLMENKSKLFADIKDIEKASLLSKADLVTDMVYEYPELQGVVGRIYAEAEGLPKEISDSIEEHYMPVTSDGKLPQGRLGMVLSLADKIDTLVGDFAAGLIPSGSADPYGLRRMATGILRIIIEKKLPVPLKALVDKSFSLLPEKVKANANTPSLVMDFLKVRLENLWEAEGYKFDETRAVLATGFDDLLDAVERLKALKSIRPQPGFESLAAAFKRASNILKQAAKNKMNVPDSVNENGFVEEAEKALYADVRKIEAGVLELTAKKDYLNALSKIVVLKPSVDAFFDKVMVMAEDESLRSNRLALLAYTAKLFSNILDFSQLQN